MNADTNNQGLEIEDPSKNPCNEDDFDYSQLTADCDGLLAGKYDDIDDGKLKASYVESFTERINDAIQYRNMILLKMSQENPRQFEKYRKNQLHTIYGRELRMGQTEKDILLKGHKANKWKYHNGDPTVTVPLCFETLPFPMSKIDGFHLGKDGCLYVFDCSFNSPDVAVMLKSKKIGLILKWLNELKMPWTFIACYSDSKFDFMKPKINHLADHKVFYVQTNCGVQYCHHDKSMDPTGEDAKNAPYVRELNLFVNAANAMNQKKKGGKP
jgi:hypothetical protein